MINFLHPSQIGGILEQFQKAVTDVAVAGGNLVREDLEARITIAGPMETPLRNRFNRRPGNGTAHSFYRLQPNADVSKGPFYGTTPGNGVFPKGGLPTDSVESYRLTSASYANLGDVAQVTFQDQAQGRSFTDLMAEREWVKAMNVAMIEEYFIINGNSAVLQSGGGYIFDGLVTTLKTNGGNIKTATGGKITVGGVSALQKMQWDKGGVPRCVVMNSTSKGVLTAQIRQILDFHQNTANGNFSNMTGGVSMNAYDFGYGVCDFITSRYLQPEYDGSDILLSLDDKTLDTKNDGNVIEMIDVDSLHSVDLAIVATAWRKVIYETTLLKVAAPSLQGLMTGILYTGQSVENGG